MKILDQVKDTMGASVVFGQPYEKNGLTIIPASRIWAGGGGGQASADEQGAGGGLGVGARPAGAFVVKGDSVTWTPALDVNRIVLVGQILAIVGVLSWRSVAKAYLRRKSAAAK